MENAMQEPGTFGFKWAWEAVAYSPDGDAKTKVELGEVPIPIVIDAKLFEASYPGLTLKYLNGASSIRVATQGSGRRMLLKDRKVSEEALLAGAMRTLLSVRAPITTEVFIGPNDERFTTRQEAQEAWKAHYA